MKYSSPYPSVVKYTCDKNFTVRLKAMIDREAKELGFSIMNEQFIGLVRRVGEIAEETLFEKKESVAPIDGSLDQRAEKYAYENCRSCNDRSIEEGCSCSRLEAAYIAGATSITEHVTPTFKRAANDIIHNLLDAIPAQTEDKDWWPDELRHAIENANAFLEDERYQSGANSNQHPLQGLIGEDISNEATGFTRADVPCNQQGGNAVSVLDWLLKQSDLNILMMCDGCFYYETDVDGDQPLEPEDIVKMYLKENPQSNTTPPAIVEQLRECCPYKITTDEKLRQAGFFSRQIWNECCDTLASLISEKGDCNGNDRIKELEKAIWQISLGPQGDDIEWIPYVIQKCKDILNTKKAIT